MKTIYTLNYLNSSLQVFEVDGIDSVARVGTNYRVAYLDDRGRIVNGLFQASKVEQRLSVFGIDAERCQYITLTELRTRNEETTEFGACLL